MLQVAQEYLIYESLYWFAQDYFDQIATSGDLAHDTLPIC